jgi:hypothetical protein
MKKAISIFALLLLFYSGAKASNKAEEPKVQNKKVSVVKNLPLEKRLVTVCWESSTVVTSVYDPFSGNTTIYTTVYYTCYSFNMTGPM